MNDRPVNIAHTLFNEEASILYEDKMVYQTHLLEQYKTYLNTAEKISARRQSANSFFVTVNTALVSLIGYINLGDQSNGKLNGLIALAGLAISYMWYRLIRSYSDLNSAKFKVLHHIEEKLPIRPFDAEWQAVGEGKNAKLYLPFTRIEVGIPWVFFLLHLLAMVQFIWSGFFAT